MDVTRTDIVPGALLTGPRARIERDSQGVPVDKAWRAAEEFESFFITKMLDQMMQEIETDGPLGGGNAERVFRGMLNEQFAGVISRSGGIGIAESTYKEILALQEAGRS